MESELRDALALQKNYSDQVHMCWHSVEHRSCRPSRLRSKGSKLPTCGNNSKARARFIVAPGMLSWVLQAAKESEQCRASGSQMEAILKEAIAKLESDLGKVEGELQAKERELQAKESELRATISRMEKELSEKNESLARVAGEFEDRGRELDKVSRLLAEERERSEKALHILEVEVGKLRLEGKRVESEKEMLEARFGREKEEVERVTEMFNSFRSSQVGNSWCCSC